MDFQVLCFVIYADCQGSSLWVLHLFSSLVQCVRACVGAFVYASVWVVEEKEELVN